jgi:hypothetical protein
MLGAFALIMHRRPWWILVLPIPLLVWTYAGWRVYGQPSYADPVSLRLPESLRWLMWLRHEWPYQPTSLYAAGRLYHFVGLLPAVVSPLLIPFVILGVARSVRRLWPRDHEERCQTLIAAIPLMILAGHSVLYWLGKMASNGELRYLIVVAPFWGLLGAKGWEHVCERLHLRHVYIPAALAALLPMLINLYYPVIPIHLSGDGHKAREVARWYRSPEGEAIAYPRLMSSNPEVAYFMGVSHTDAGWVREWRRELLLKPQPGTLLVWDPVYAKYNSDANRVASLDEIRAAGWIERDDLAEKFNWISSGEPWHFFVSPTSIFGKPSP